MADLDETPNFLCQVGGYDLHTNQTPGPGLTTLGSHAKFAGGISANPSCRFKGYGAARIGE